MPADPFLSSSTRRSQYQALEANRNREAIAAFFTERFTERYVTPIESTPRKKKNGFTTMAVSCLLIETLESFWNGWPTTDRKSALAFCQFFARTTRFHVLLGHVPDFYRHVRCGILHQGETTGGWTIRRTGVLFDPSGPTINATKFHRELQKEICEYATSLRTKLGTVSNGEISARRCSPYAGAASDQRIKPVCRSLLRKLKLSITALNF